MSTLVKFGKAFWRLYNKILDKAIRIYYSKCIPVSNGKVVFATYNNKYICNPKYIHQALIKLKPDCDIVWLVDEKEDGKYFPDKIRLVCRETRAAYREIAGAQVLIDNSVNMLWRPVPKKRNQVFIETWHGSLGFKRFGRKYNKNKRWVFTALKSRKYVDYCISNSDFEDMVYTTSYWGKSKILKLGHARNDILFQWERKREELMEETYFKEKGINNNCRYVLYAPTFRENHTTNQYYADFEIILKALKQRFGGKWKIMFRYHYQDRRRKQTDILGDNVINVSDYADMQELLCIADAGITDYSSWICDFLLTGKPGFLYARDMTEYENDRGFYEPLNEAPFPVAKDTKMLIKRILEFDETIYCKRKEEFLTRKGCIDDGRASERIADFVVKIIKNGDKGT